MSNKVLHIDWIRANALYDYDHHRGHSLIYKDQAVDITVYSGARSSLEGRLLSELCKEGYAISGLCDAAPTIKPETTTSLPDSSDSVNHPAHYNQGNIESIDAIRAALTEEEFRGHLKGNALKYIWRSNHKGKPDEDIRKAIWYLNKLIGGDS